MRSHVYLGLQDLEADGKVYVSPDKVCAVRRYGKGGTELIFTGSVKVLGEPVEVTERLAMAIVMENEGEQDGTVGLMDDPTDGVNAMELVDNKVQTKKTDKENN